MQPIHIAYLVYGISALISLSWVCQWVYKQISTNNVFTILDIVKYVGVNIICWVPVINTITSCYIIISILYDYVVEVLSRWSNIVIYRK